MCASLHYSKSAVQSWPLSYGGTPALPIKHCFVVLSLLEWHIKAGGAGNMQSISSLTLTLTQTTEIAYLSGLYMLLMINSVLLTDKSSRQWGIFPVFLAGFFCAPVKLIFHREYLNFWSIMYFPSENHSNQKNSKLTCNLYNQLEQLALPDSRAIK